MSIQILIDFKNKEYIYNVINNNTQLLSASFEMYGQCISGEIINQNNQKYEIVRSSREQATYPANPMTTLKLTHKILLNDKFWGEIAYCKSLKSEISSGYKIETKDNKYDIFSIYMGKNGLTMPIYLNEKQIALIENRKINENNLLGFNIVIPEENNKEYILVCTIACMFCYFEKYLTNGKPYNTHFGWTTKKSIKEKYDKAFKNKYL